MLDTNMVSHMIRFPDGPVVTRAKHHGYQALCVSVMTAAELRFGVRKRASAQLEMLVEGALSYLPVLPFEETSTQNYAQVRYQLPMSGQMIGPVDLFIAALSLSLSLSLGLTLVTANTREFLRVDGLAVENWLEDAS